MDCLMILLELFLFFGAVGGLFDLSRKRGANPWLVSILAIAGWVGLRFGIPVLGFLGLKFAIPTAALSIALPWVWLVVVYFALFVLINRRRGGTTSWQCPVCLGRNEGFAVACLCGYRPEEE